MAEIDVTDRGQLDAFLQEVVNREDDRQQVVAFATRAALRCVPAFAALDLRPDSEDAPTILLPSLRAISMSWVVVEYPILQAGSAVSARRFAQSAARSAAGFFSPVGLSVHAAFSAAESARFAFPDFSLRSAFSARSALAAADAAQSARSAAHTTAGASLASALSADVERMELGETLIDQPLWLNEGGEPQSSAKMWAAMTEQLLALDQDWEVWIDWYEARARGEPTYLLSPVANERIEVARVREVTDEDWDQGPAHVNATIKAIVEREIEADERRGDEETALSDGLILSGTRTEQPEIPDPGPGPVYGNTEGQLSREQTPPQDGDEEASAKLLPRLTQTAKRLADHTNRLSNTHPDLAFAIDEYVYEVDRPFEDLDIAGLFATGGAVMEMNLAYQPGQDDHTTIHEPLEPETRALLGSLSRQHGAFLVGTQDGRDLVERADRALQHVSLLKEVEEPGSVLLDALTDDRQFVDERTRKAHQPLRDVLQKIGWTSGRTGYAAMRVVFKAGHFTLTAIFKASIVAGSAASLSAVLGDPEMQFLRVAVPFVRDYSAQLLAFYKHSPEMRSYAEYVLSVMDDVEKQLNHRS